MPDPASATTPRKSGRTMRACSPGEWSLALDRDPRDAVDTALRHGRADLFYGRHYLRFTRRRTADGSLSLRLEERAVVVGEGGNLTLVAAERLPSRFVCAETVPQVVGPDRSGAGLDAVAGAARRLFARAAVLLDEADRRLGWPQAPLSTCASAGRRRHQVGRG
jgi:hypothetical protein